MLFVLAARREAPLQLVVVTRRGVPATAILASSVVGSVCYRRRDLAGHDLRVPAQLQRRDHPVRLPADLHLADRAADAAPPDSQLRVKMWLFPVLSILTAVAILAILVQMGLQEDIRSQRS